MYASIWSSVKTPPSVKNYLSESNEITASLNEPHTVGTPFSSSSESEYKSLSNGLPGSILFFIPSKPAMSIDANAVHGSDSIDSAKREIEYFFNAEEILNK